MSSTIQNTTELSLVPASNEMLARRVVELTNERDNLTKKLEQQSAELMAVKTALHGRAINNAELREQLQHLDNAFEVSKAQFEQLREDSLIAFGDGFYEGYLHYAKLCGDADFTDDAIRQSELAEAQSVYGKQVGSSARVAEIKAKAVEDAIHATKQSFDGLGPKWLCKVQSLEQYANRIRQQTGQG